MSNNIIELKSFYEKNSELIDLDIFYNWFVRKLNINYFYNWPKYIKERQIWLCYLWQNIDWEQNWEKENFLRPILILKSWWTKVKHITALPLTKNYNKNWIFTFKLDKKQYTFLDFNSVVLIDKIKTLSKQRIIWYKSLWYISKDDFIQIKEKIRELYNL